MAKKKKSGKPQSWTSRVANNLPKIQSPTTLQKFDKFLTNPAPRKKKTLRKNP